jgi:hypothetical protein
MIKLIDTLNNPKTPDSVKKDYAMALDMKVANSKDIGKLEFKKENFTALLDRNKDNINLNTGRKK